MGTVQHDERLPGDDLQPRGPGHMGKPPGNSPVRDMPAARAKLFDAGHGDGGVGGLVFSQ